MYEFRRVLRVVLQATHFLLFPPQRIPNGTQGVVTRASVKALHMPPPSDAVQSTRSGTPLGDDDSGDDAAKTGVGAFVETPLATPVVAADAAAGAPSASSSNSNGSGGMGEEASDSPVRSSLEDDPLDPVQYMAVDEALAKVSVQGEACVLVVARNTPALTTPVALCTDSFQVATTHGGEALKAALARAHATIAEEDNAAGTEANGDGGEEDGEEGEEEDAAMTAAAAAMSGQELVRTLPVRCGAVCVVRRSHETSIVCVHVFRLCRP